VVEVVVDWGDIHMSPLTPFGVFLPELEAALVAAFFCVSITLVLVN